MIDYLAHLRADADAVLAVLARDELSSPVAACPGWTVRELVEHLGNVHRWATQIVLTGEPAREPDGRPADLAEWFAAGADGLRLTLAAADPRAPCWSFTTDKTKGFWVRRQALETAVHRWDAEDAAGKPGLIDPGLAADGVGEVVGLMTPRQAKLGRIPPLTSSISLQAVDTGDRWVLGDGDVAGSVTASAGVLLLLLWHRVDPSDPRVRLEGCADDLLRLPLAP